MLRTVQLLLQRGADPLQLDSEGRSALHLAAAAGHRAALDLLLDSRGVRSVLGAPDGQPRCPPAAPSPLHLAVSGTPAHDAYTQLDSYTVHPHSATRSIAQTVGTGAACHQPTAAARSLISRVSDLSPPYQSETLRAWCDTL